MCSLMKFTGKLKQPIIDFMTHRLTILFEPNEDFKQAYEELKDCDKLSLEIKPYKRKRSLDANAYYWVLLTKLAKILRISNAELHNVLLSKYGFMDIVDGRTIKVVLPDTDEANKKVMESQVYHLRPTSDARMGNDGMMYRTYVMIRGSSTYDTAEMSRLIDGLVSDCRDVGMADAEIASPEERRILREKYGIDF